MNTTAYQGLVAEIENWEDFIFEGGGTLGCCGVDPAQYASPTACGSACVGTMAVCSTGKMWKPAGCTKSIATAKGTCCWFCCGFGTPTCKGGAFAVGSKNCGPGGGTINATTVKVFCHNAPTPRTIFITTGPFKNKIIRTNVGCVP